MKCEAFAREACPCVLADIELCRCCSLLNGQQICQCDYPGECIYEKHRWEEVQPLGNYDHIAAVFPAPTACGVIIRWSESETAIPGLVLSLSQPGRPNIHGVVLKTFPEQKLAYLLVTDRFNLIEREQLTVRSQHNVFGGDSIHVAHAAGRKVVILADSDLLPLLDVFAKGLQQQGADVQMFAVTDKAICKAADLFIFISRNREDLTLTLKRLPIYCKNSAFWFVD